MDATKTNELARFTESGTWVRAIQLKFWSAADPLHTFHTRHHATRYNPGRKGRLHQSMPTGALPGFETLYLAENHQVAAFEVGSLLGSPYTPGAVIASPRSAWVYIGVQANLQSVADLALIAEQEKVQTTVQELTGDWRGYDLRGYTSSVSAPIGLAETQQLGESLYQAGWEGFRTVSVRVPDSRTLVVFPDNLQQGSWLRFENPLSETPVLLQGTR